MEHPLRVWREAHQMNQDEFAVYSGFTQSFISLLEAGKRRAGALNARKLLKAVHNEIPLDAFLYPEEYINSTGPAPTGPAEKPSLATPEQLAASPTNMQVAEAAC